MSSREAFEFALDTASASTCIKITSTGSVQPVAIPFGPNVIISCKTTACFIRWGTAVTLISDGTAATQGFWIPANAIIRLAKPPNATHLIVLQDGSAGILFVSPGMGM